MTLCYIAGEWPVPLDPDAWMGGNLAAEALFGVWNPVNGLNADAGVVRQGNL